MFSISGHNLALWNFGLGCNHVLMTYFIIDKNYEKDSLKNETHKTKTFSKSTNPKPTHHPGPYKNGRISQDPGGYYIGMVSSKAKRRQVNDANKTLSHGGIL